MSEETTTDLASMPIGEVPITYKTLGALIKTPTVPDRYRKSESGVNDMLAAALIGREMGIGPMEAIDKIVLINGSKSMYGTLMCAQIYRHGHELRVNVKPKSVTVKALRRDPYTHQLVEQGEWTFGEADAKKAYLSGKDTYEEYPQLMWAWRAISAIARIYFADCLAGISYLPEEVGVNDVPVEPLPGYVALDVDGETLEKDEATLEVMEAFPDAEVVGDA